MVLMVKSYRLCVFLNDVMCSHRRSKSFSVGKYCLKCPHYEEFMREMDAEDERVMDEIDRERAMFKSL